MQDQANNAFIDKLHFLMVQLRIAHILTVNFAPNWNSEPPGQRCKGLFQTGDVTFPALFWMWLWSCGGSNQIKTNLCFLVWDEWGVTRLCNKQNLAFPFNYKELCIIFSFLVQDALSFRVPTVLIFFSVFLAPLNITVEGYARQGNQKKHVKPLRTTQSGTEQGEMEILLNLLDSITHSPFPMKKLRREFSHSSVVLFPDTCVLYCFNSVTCRQ